MSLRQISLFALGVAAAVPLMGIAACGPASDRTCDGTEADLQVDPSNCGTCGNVCSAGFACIDYRCIEGSCQPGKTEECYTGHEGTQGVGPCTAGVRTCEEGGIWSTCTGEVIPTAENCTDGIDNNCNGAVDDDIDADMDGFTTCAGDCCDSTECSKPALVNPSAFDAIGNNVDDDCNGVVDDTLLLCDQGIASNTTAAMDFARAIDICQTTTEAESKWGVISATLTGTDGAAPVDANGHSVRPSFGTNVLPQGGVNLAILSTGAAAAKTDMAPPYKPFSGYSHTGVNTAPFPADFLAANGGMLPNAPGCPAPNGSVANDPVMLTLRVRVPSNAQSFKLSSNFYSAEFPEYTCSPYNDFFVVLLDSTYMGANPNPMDKNLAFYQPAGSMTKVPVGVNLGHGNTGLFTQCINGETGCLGMPGTITTCTAMNHLVGTGFDESSGLCDTGQVVGGATGWLVTTGNVTPGEIITLRIAVWDTSDHILDSLAVIDGFQWSTEVAQPGTDILISR